jgi:hypothetical protein
MSTTPTDSELHDQAQALAMLAAAAELADAAAAALRRACDTVAHRTAGVVIEDALDAAERVGTQARNANRWLIAATCDDSHFPALTGHHLAQWVAGFRDEVAREHCPDVSWAIARCSLQVDAWADHLG